ncbi:hypothetical protein, partial [Nocardia thailandica]|uniref:hypothetical protein n=1 Tax=Nocardia thailandica TaxID=257275 RepID=UPI001C3F30D3
MWLVQQGAQGRDVGGAGADLVADPGVDLGELGGGEALVLVDAAVAVPLVDLGPALRFGVREVEAEQACVVAARTGEGVVRGRGQGAGVGEVGRADLAEEVEGVAVVHRRVVAAGARVGRGVVDEAVGVRVDGGQRPDVVGERPGQVVRVAPADAVG